MGGASSPGHSSLEMEALGHAPGAARAGSRREHAPRLSLSSGLGRAYLLRCGLLILTWYFLSTALGMFNKVLVGKKHGVFGQGSFPAPLLLTGVQFACQHLLARAVFGCGLMTRSGAPMSWRDWSRLVLPNGVVTGLDIGFSNTSLVYITMSFYTMCKSTTPIFLLAFAFLWGLETPSWGLAGVVGVIVAGLVLLVQGEAEFHAAGFLLVMSASCMSGLRFTLTQVLLHGNKGAAGASSGSDRSSSHHSSGGQAGTDGGSGKGSSPRSGPHEHGPSHFGGPLEVLESLTPVMSATTLLVSLASERLWAVLPASPYFAGPQRCLATLGIIAVGAVLAFLMVWTEYQVIKETSSLTFMIAGTVKEVVTVMTAVAVFGDKFGPINGVGLAVVIAGVLLFNHYKLVRLRGEARTRLLHEDTSLHLGDGGGSSGSSSSSSSGPPPLSNGRLSPEPGGASQLALRPASVARRHSGGGGADDESGGASPEQLGALEAEPLLRTLR